MMLFDRFTLVLATVLIAGAGCGGAGAPTSETASQEEPVSVAGLWVGEYYWDRDVPVPGLAPFGSTFELKLTQSGNELSGTIRPPSALGWGTPCFTYADVTGTVSGSDVEMTAVPKKGALVEGPSPQRVAYTGSVSGSSMSGGFEASNCIPDAGTWRLSKGGWDTWQQCDAPTAEECADPERFGTP